MCPVILLEIPKNCYVYQNGIRRFCSGTIFYNNTIYYIQAYLFNFNIKASGYINTITIQGIHSSLYFSFFLSFFSFPFFFFFLFFFFRFRNGSLNCIVATDVIDEGIDVPKCSLIIRYDLPMDVRTYIQSKGRARHAYSRYVVLLQSDDSQYLRRHNEYKKIEQHLKQVPFLRCQ